LATWFPCRRGRTLFIFGVITIIPFDNLYRRAYFVMHTFLVKPNTHKLYILRNSTNIVYIKYSLILYNFTIIVHQFFVNQNTLTGRTTNRNLILYKFIIKNHNNDLHVLLAFNQGHIIVLYFSGTTLYNYCLHSDIWFWFRVNQSLLFLLNSAACLAEKQ
jgi:hypothetical protein